MSGNWHFAAPDSVGGERRCGMCRKKGHVTLACPLREQAKVCSRCCSMSWRVVGPRCVTCRLVYAPEPPVELQLEARRDR